MRLWTPGALIFISTLLVFAFSLNGIWSADHPTSLLELSYSLWAKHSVVLGRVGEFNPQSVDDFFYQGNYYSALAPGVSFLALPLVGLGFVLDGKFTRYGDAMLLSELFIAICNACAAYLVYRLASIYFTEKTSVFVAFAYAFSTISWPFATFFFESDVSAMLDLFAVYLAIRMARGRSSTMGSAALCGLALGVAVTVTYLNAVLVPVVALFLLYSFRKDAGGFAKRFAGFIVTSAVGFVLVALYNQAAFGSPFITTEQAYLHTSSVFGSFSYPILDGLYLDLFSPLRGVFLFCPMLVLGALGLYRMLRRHDLQAEGVLLAACFVGMLIPYSMWYNAVGGEAFGQRFLIPAIPFLLLPFGFVIEGKRRDLARLAYLLYGVGVLFNGIAAVTTAIPQAAAVSTFPFLSQVLPTFLKGTLDAWWWKGAGELRWVLVVLIVGTAAVLPLVVNRLSSMKRPAKSS